MNAGVLTTKEVVPAVTLSVESVLANVIGLLPPRVTKPPPGRFSWFASVAPPLRLVCNTPLVSVRRRPGPWHSRRSGSFAPRGLSRYSD